MKPEIFTVLFSNNPLFATIKKSGKIFQQGREKYSLTIM
jgi:hypothetical protein